MTPATLLTLLRIALIPVLVVVFYLPFKWSALASALIFILASITDWLDGYLARKWNQTSRFGAFLDPVADKLIVATALVLLVQAYPSPWMALAASIIIGREIIVSALREWMAEIGERSRVAVSTLGKVKTVLQMLAIIFLLYHDPLWDIPIDLVGNVLLLVAVVLTLWSMVIYLKAVKPQISKWN